MVQASDRQHGLFEKPTFLEWLPGETLFSLISRHHFFWGNTLASQTCKQFFNHSRGGAQHDFPSHLGNFVENTHACFGSVKEVAEERTLLSFYGAFLAIDARRSAVASMEGSSVAHLKLRLGILTSRFRANHPLKSCPSCMEEDRVTHGWNYWHRHHQYPGVWVCQKHGVLLKESNLKANGVERFHWHLPAHESFLKLPRNTVDAIAKDVDVFHRLSMRIMDLTAQGQIREIDTGQLHTVYSIELERRGWRTSGGNLRMAEVAASYFDHVRPLRSLPELSAIASSLSMAKTELTRLLSPPRSGTHPLRHLVLIDWLFSTNEEFWRAYAQVPANEQIASAGTQVLPGSNDVETKDPRFSKLVDLLKVEGLSISKAARAVDVDVQTAMTWAVRAGLSVSRRPKKLVDGVRQLVVSKLKKGVDKTAAAELGGVSVVTITKLLLTEVGLHAQWTRARTRRAQSTARKAWKRILKSQGHLGVKIMREIDPASYAWLYRHNRVWLKEHQPGRVPNNFGSNAPRVLWDARDTALCSKVEHAALELRSSEKLKRLRLWHLYQAVPELKAKLAKLDRLPLTRHSIDQALTPITSNSAPQLF